MFVYILSDGQSKRPKRQKKWQKTFTSLLLFVNLVCRLVYDNNFYSFVYREIDELTYGLTDEFKHPFS